MKKFSIQSILSAIGILLLILDSKNALLGAQNGIELCIRSIIPSIFPFLILSGMLTSGITGMNVAILRPLARLLRIPQGTEMIFLTGILGGYPTGAQSVYQAWENGCISEKDAKRMLAFCSNAGPSFLFGILGTMFTKRWMLWALWGIHIISAVMVGMCIPGSAESKFVPAKSSAITLTQSLKRAVTTMSHICGWVILFRILLSFLDKGFLWLFMPGIRVGIYGILELANGCCALMQISSEVQRFILASGMLVFGGICVGMQTASVVKDLGMGKYWHGKLLQTLISLWLSILLQGTIYCNGIIRFFLIVILCSTILMPILPLFLRKSKIGGRNPAIIGV